MPGAIHIWSDPSNSNIYIGKYISENNGSSWSSVSGLGEVGHVFSYNSFDGKVYAGVFSKIKGKPFLFEASDGKSFSSFTSGMDSKAQTTRHVVYGDSLIVDANIAGGNSIIYYKKPGDASFSEFDNTGLPNTKAEPIYANEYSLFVGSVEGVYRYDLKTLPEVSDTVDQITYPPVVSVDVSLKTLTVDNGTLSPAFSASTLDYLVELASGTTDVPTVVAETNDDSASVDIVQAIDVNGSQAERTATITVTGKDGETTRDYTIVFFVLPEAGKDATLSNLSLSEGTLNPAFSPAVENYTVTLPGGTTEVPVVTAETTDANATKNVSQATNVTGTESERTATVEVTSEDETETKTYTVVFSIETGTSIDGINKIKTRIYPNPVSDYLKIESSSPIDVITFYNMQGKIMKQLQGVTSKTISIDISALEGGLYLMQVQEQNGVISIHKIIKE